MKTISLNLFKFEELSEEAKQNAINAHREHVETSYIYDEAHETIKAFNALFGTKEGDRSWLDVRTGHIDDVILNLKGLRLRTWLLNNIPSLYNPAYLRCVEKDVPIHHPRVKSQVLSNGKHFNPFYSGWKKDHSCVLTGVCYDDIMLAPVYEFIDWKLRPDYNTYQTLESLINDCFEAIDKAVQEEENYRYSDEGIAEELTANDDDYREDGEIY